MNVQAYQPETGAESAVSISFHLVLIVFLVLSREGMTRINHPLQFPLRGAPDSFPHARPIAPGCDSTQISFVVKENLFFSSESWRVRFVKEDTTGPQSKPFAQRQPFAGGVEVRRGNFFRKDTQMGAAQNETND